MGNKSKKFTPAQVGNLIKRLRINIVILSVGVTEKQALDDMRHVANSNADKCIGEIIEISSSPKSMKHLLILDRSLVRIWMFNIIRFYYFVKFIFRKMISVYVILQCVCIYIYTYSIYIDRSK